MAEYGRALLGLIIELTVLAVCGTFLADLLKIKAGLSLRLVLGYFLYFGLFEILTVPMILTWASLHTLCLVWGILLILITAGAVILEIKRKKHHSSPSAGIRSFITDHSLWITAAAAAVILQCVLAVLYQDTTVDAAYYVGTTSTSVYTGTLGRYSPYTGAPLKNFQGRYVFSAYPMHNAVWCVLLGLHPLVQSKVVMILINVLFANLVIYHLGLSLFKGGKKQADLMVCLVCVMQLFSYTIYTPGTFLFTRGYEGKALLANLVFPAVVLMGVWYYREQRPAYFAVLTLLSLSGACFSGSSVILPAAVIAAILPTLVMRRRFSHLIFLGLSLVPSLIYGILYLGTSRGWLVFPAS